MLVKKKDLWDLTDTQTFLHTTAKFSVLHNSYILQQPYIPSLQTWSVVWDEYESKHY